MWGGDLVEQDINGEIVLHDQLYVGNSDSILLFGCEAQQQLREFSKAVSSQLAERSGNMEYVIQDILNEIEDFENYNVNSIVFFRKTQKKKRSRMIKKYNTILNYMNKMELALKLQEAQLLKDSKIFEELGKCIQTTVANLEELLLYGENVLKQQSCTEQSDDIKRWYERLTRRLEDLRISHTVLLQSKLQISIMLENSDKLVDKIIETITTTLPVWRNQVTILLGIEHMNNNLTIQNKLAEINKKYVNVQTISRKKIGGQKEVESDELSLVNVSMKKSLSRLIDSEKQDEENRLKLSKILN